MELPPAREHRSRQGEEAIRLLTPLCDRNARAQHRKRNETKRNGTKRNETKSRPCPTRPNWLGPVHGPVQTARHPSFRSPTLRLQLRSRPTRLSLSRALRCQIPTPCWAPATSQSDRLVREAVIPHIINHELEITRASQSNERSGTHEWKSFFILEPAPSQTIACSGHRQHASHVRSLVRRGQSAKYPRRA